MEPATSRLSEPEPCLCHNTAMCVFIPNLTQAAHPQLHLQPSAISLAHQTPFMALHQLPASGWQGGRRDCKGRRGTCRAGGGHCSGLYSLGGQRSMQAGGGQRPCQHAICVMAKRLRVERWWRRHERSSYRAMPVQEAPWAAIPTSSPSSSSRLPRVGGWLQGSGLLAAEPTLFPAPSPVQGWGVAGPWGLPASASDPPLLPIEESEPPIRSLLRY